MTDFHDHLKELPNDDYVWYDFWQNQKGSLDINYCNAIMPIHDELSTACLCQLPIICDDICDKDIGHIFVDTVNAFFEEDPYAIPYDLGVTHSDCSNVMTLITDYKALCGDTEIYKVIEDCGM